MSEQDDIGRGEGFVFEVYIRTSLLINLLLATESSFISLNQDM